MFCQPPMIWENGSKVKLAIFMIVTSLEFLNLEVFQKTKREKKNAYNSLRTDRQKRRV